MALIPIKIGNLSALVYKPEPSRCCVPGCHGDHWTSCEYPVGRQLATARTCDAKVCEDHVTKWGELEVCPAHARWIESSGNSSTAASSGNKVRAKAGENGLIILTWWDDKAERYHACVGEVGIDGIEAGVLYEVVDGKLSKVK